MVASVTFLLRSASGGTRKARNALTASLTSVLPRIPLSWSGLRRRYAEIARLDNARARRSSLSICVLMFLRRNSAVCCGSAISPVPSRKSQAIWSELSTRTGNGSVMRRETPQRSHRSSRRRLQTWRSKPLAHVCADVGLPRQSKEAFALDSRAQQLRLFSKTNGFLAESFFQ